MPGKTPIRYVGPLKTVGPVDASIVNAKGEPVVNVTKGRTVYTTKAIAAELVKHENWEAA